MRGVCVCEAVLVTVIDVDATHTHERERRRERNPTASLFPVAQAEKEGGDVSTHRILLMDVDSTPFEIKSPPMMPTRPPRERERAQDEGGFGSQLSREEEPP